MNNSTNTYFDIFEIIRLKSQADEVIVGLDDIALSMFNIKGISLRERIKNRFSEDIAELILNYITKNNHSDSDLSASKTIIEEFKKLLSDTKVAYLTIGIKPDSSIINFISDLCRDKFQDKALLIDIKVDHKLIGGLELIWKGKYHNLSLAKKIDEYFSKSYGAI